SVSTLPGPLAGVRWRDTAPVLETHRGTGTQRELLATREPVAGCHLAFSREELDCGIEPFLDLVERYRRHPGRQCEVADGAGGWRGRADGHWGDGGARRVRAPGVWPVRRPRGGLHSGDRPLLAARLGYARLRGPSSGRHQ